MAEHTNPSDEERQAAAVHVMRDQGWLTDGDDPVDVEPERYDDCEFSFGAVEYLVLTEAEADDRARDACERDAWAFNADFLAGYMPEGIGADEIEAMRGNRCEDFNDAALALIRAGRGFEAFWTDAVETDGRGHFLAGYDGNEIEVGDIDGHDWYAYRTN